MIPGDLAGGQKTTDPREDPRNELFEILANRWRRDVLRSLRDRSGVISLTELAKHVASREQGKGPDEIPEKETKKVYVSLCQTHVPRLDTAGLVSYDPDDRVVTAARGEPFDLACRHMAAASKLSNRVEELSADTILAVVQNGRRRFVLEYLEDTGGEAELSEVTENLAATENRVSVEDVTSRQLKAVYNPLYQTHLPMLDDVGLVDYDENTGRLTLLPSGSLVITILRDDPGSLYTNATLFIHWLRTNLGL